MRTWIPAAIATIVITGSVNAADLAPVYKAAPAGSGTGRLQLVRILPGRQRGRHVERHTGGPRVIYDHRR